MIPAWSAIGLGFPIGLCLGSYATTAAMRRARSQASSRGRSHCDGCGAGLGFAQTVPIYSYLQRHGACGLCGARIDSLHPMGEMAGGLAVAMPFALLAPATALLVAALGLVLLAASVFDAKTQRLPDALTLAAGLVCAGLALAHGLPRLAVNAAIAAASIIVLEGLGRLFKLASGEAGLGFGDVKLIAALALWLGALTPWMVTLASIAGLGAVALRRRAERRIAFGPFIAAAAFVFGLLMEARQWP